MRYPSHGSWVIAGFFAFSSLGVSGCGKEKLTEIEVPESGVSLRYDLAAGQAYGGHIRMRNAVQTPMGDLIQAIEFDVDMVVLGPKGDKSLVRAKVADIAIDIRLPDGVPAAMAGSIPPEAVAAVNGHEVRFAIDGRGEVSDMPPPPEDASQEIQAVIGMVSGALQSGFVVVPDQAVKAGDSWNAIDAADDDQAGRTGTGKLTGMARDESGEDVAKLEYAFERTAPGEPGEPGQPQLQSGSQKVAALFSVRGFPVQVERQMSGEIKGLGGMNSEVKARWTKLDKRAVEAVPAESAVDEQVITDPCDPDYVGAEECVTDGESTPAPAEGEEAAAPDAGS